MPHALAPTLAMILLAANPQAPEGGAPEGAPTSSAIVGGRHIQPRGGGSASDVPRNDAADVDRLYRELMGTSPDAGSNPKPPGPSRRP
jgi:hypothetical protein